MRTLFALGVLTLGLAIAAGNAVASDDGDGKHRGRSDQDGRTNYERSDDRDIATHKTKRYDESGDRSGSGSQSSSESRADRDGDRDNERRGKSERRDGDRS